MKKLLQTPQVSIPDDTVLIAAIKQGGPRLDIVMKKLYSCAPVRGRVEHYVMVNNGNLQDAEDIYQEGLCALILNIQGGKFRGQSSVQHYLFKICKNTWLKRLHKKKLARKYSSAQSGLNDVDLNMPDTILHKKKLMELVDTMLNECDKDAKAVLSLWKLSYSFQEIATELNLKDAARARKIKFRALKKLYILVNKYPEFKDYYT